MTLALFLAAQNTRICCKTMQLRCVCKCVCAAAAANAASVACGGPDPPANARQRRRQTEPSYAPAPTNAELDFGRAAYPSAAAYRMQPPPQAAQFVVNNPSAPAAPGAYPSQSQQGSA